MKNDFINQFIGEIELLTPYLPQDFFKKCLKYQSIFHINIPKTGSTFLNHLLKTNYLIKSYRPPHGTCSRLRLSPDPTDGISGKQPTLYQNLEGFKESLKISIVRNPYDWLVSFYFHEELRKKKNVNKLRPSTSEVESLEIARIKGVGSLRKLYTTFEDFVFAYSDPDAYWPQGLIGFKNFFPFQMFDDEGVCQADYCLRNETLSLSIYSLFLGFGVDCRAAQDVLRADKKNVSLTRKRKDYREYYNDKMVLALEDKFKNINKHMGYSFEKPILSDQFIISLKNLNYSPIDNRII